MGRTQLCLCRSRGAGRANTKTGKVALVLEPGSNSGFIRGVRGMMRSSCTVRAMVP
jgi:hypothetical protein